MSFSSVFLLAFLLPVVIAGPVAQSNEICTEVPSSFWCSLSDDLQKQCGFTDLCNRYTQAHLDKPVALTVFYESLCGGCQQFITETIPKLLENYGEDGKIVTLELVPFGNAKIEENGTITCQHGPEECKNNLFESCILAHLGPKAFGAVICVERELKNDPEANIYKVLDVCFDELVVEREVQGRVINCAWSDEGKQLQLAAGKRTAEATYPDKLRGVPWVLVNNISMVPAQIITEEITSNICLWYKGSKTPFSCNL